MMPPDELRNRRKARYRHDEAYRLRCINHARAGRGSPLIATLSDCYTRAVPASERPRDERGRFVTEAR